jgi:hypothetical protein
MYPFIIFAAGICCPCFHDSFHWGWCLHLQCDCIEATLPAANNEILLNEITVPAANRALCIGVLFICIYFEVVLFAVYSACNSSHQQPGKTDSWRRSHCTHSCTDSRAGSADSECCPGFWFLYICTQHLHIWWGSQRTPGKTLL